MAFDKETEKEIDKLFKELDEDNSGYIDLAELHRGFQTIGLNLSTSEVKRAFALIDTSGDNKIQLEEFKVMMFERVSKNIMIFDDLEN